MGRPFLKCGLILDWHIPSKEVSMCFVDELNTLLRNNEYERRLKSPQRMSKNRQDNPDVINDSLETTSGLNELERTKQDHLESKSKLRIATIGLRSVLRSMQKGVVTMVFLDANLLRPSAVSTVLGLYAISCNAVNVYALEGLDVTISKSLNFRVVGAVGLCENEQTDAICTKAKRELRPVERVCTRTSRMSMPLIAAELNVSCGKQKKSGKKKKKSKLKVNFVTN